MGGGGCLKTETGNSETDNNILWGLKTETGNSEAGNNIWGVVLKSETGNFGRDLKSETGKFEGRI